MFCDNLKKAREYSNLSKADISKKLGLKYTTYDNYERGSAEPKLEMLVKIADLLNVSTDDLLGRTLKNEDEQLEKDIKFLLSDNKQICRKEGLMIFDFDCINKNSVNFVEDMYSTIYLVNVNYDKPINVLIKKENIINLIQRIKENSIYQEKKSFLEYINNAITSAFNGDYEEYGVIKLENLIERINTNLNK